MPFNHNEKETYKALEIDDKDYNDVIEALNHIKENPELYDTISKKIEYILNIGFNYQTVAYACYLLGKVKEKTKEEEFNRFDGLGGSIVVGPFPGNLGKDALLDLLGKALGGNQKLFGGDNPNKKDSNDSDDEDDEDDLNNKYKNK